MKGKIFFFLVLNFLIFVGCSSPKHSNFSYRINTYEYQNVEKRPNQLGGDYISYNGHLFEMIVKTSNEFITDGKTTSLRSTRRDTTGVFIIKAGDTTMHYFDGFTTMAKLQNSKSRYDEKLGFRYVRFTGDNDGILSAIQVRDTVVNNIPLSYIDSVEKNSEGNDSLRWSIIMIKEKGFVTPNSILGLRYMDNDYTVIGQGIQLFPDTAGIRTELELIRPLRKDELEICKSMLLKIKANKGEVF